MILLDSGRTSLRNWAKLVTIRQQLRKVFDRYPQVRGNRHRVDLWRRGQLAVTELRLRILQRSSRDLQQCSVSPPQSVPVELWCADLRARRFQMPVQEICRQKLRTLRGLRQQQLLVDGP